MCEVTKHNFRDLYPEIEDSMKKSDFFSVDSEFSGLSSSSKISYSLFDNGPERYLKVKDNINQIIALQIGISCFKFIRECNEYSCRVYRFYIFPRSFGTFDQRFLCQSSSFDFLANNNFDFSKVVFGGLSCLNNIQIADLKKKLDSGALFNHLERSVSLYSKSLIQKVCSDVAKWLVVAQLGNTLLVMSGQDTCSYLLHKEIRQRFTRVWTFTHEKGILIKVITPKERFNLNKSGSNTRLDEMVLDGLMGFTKVFRLLASLKKPIIGHNLLLDLLIMYNQFYNPLPQTLKSFKRSVNKLFPVVYDTKHMSYILKNILKKGDRFKVNALEELYEYLKTKGNAIAGYAPKVTIEPGFYIEDDKQQIHEAGWDSFITGYCFIKMAHYFSVTFHEFYFTGTSIQHLSALVSMRNKVNIVRGNITHLNLEGSDPKSTHPPLLYISRKIKQKLSYNQLVELFAKYGAIDFKYRSPHTVIAAAPSFGCVHEILKEFKNNKYIKVEVERRPLQFTKARKAVKTGIALLTGICLWFFLRHIQTLTIFMRACF